MLLPRSLRAPARHVLAAVAVSCVLFAALSLLATLAAGTLQMDGDYPDGAGYLFLEDLAPVRLYGILPSTSSSNTTTTDPKQPESAQGVTLEPYQVRISIFLSAIGYSWPRSPRWSTSAGIIRNTVFLLPPDPSASFPLDLAAIAKRMHLPEEDYACLHPDAAGHQHFLEGPPCANAFLETWLLASSTYLTSSGELEFKNTDVTTFDNTLASLMYIAALAGLGWVVLRQVFMRAHERRRQGTDERVYDCPEVCGVNIGEEWWCPCERMGERTMGPAQRSRARLCGLVVVGALYAIAQAIMWAQALRIKMFLQGVERAMRDTAAAGANVVPPEGEMNPQIGSGFLVLGVSTSAAILAAWACLLARDKLRTDDVDGDQGFMLVPRDEESAGDVPHDEREPHDEDDDAVNKNSQGSG